MTNSFQSTAFQSSARPVDTFVQPVSAPETTGIMQLAKALEDVNPNIQKFIATKMELAVQDEQSKGMELAIEEASEGFSEVVKLVRNKDGKEAANQLIGGSIFADRAYQKSKASILANTFKSNFENKYNTTIIDGKPLSSYPFESDVFQNWLTETRNDVVMSTEGINPRYLNDEFYPKLIETTGEITSHHIEQYQEYKVSELKSLTVPLVKEVILLSKTPGQKNIVAMNELIKSFEGNINNLGFDSENRSEINELILKTIQNEAEALVFSGNGDEDDLNRIYDLAIFFPYGPNGSLNLTDHPDFLKNLNESIKKTNTFLTQQRTRANQIEKETKNKEIDETLKLYYEAINSNDLEIKNDAYKYIEILIQKYPVDTIKLQNISVALDDDPQEGYILLLNQIENGNFKTSQEALIAATAWIQNADKNKQNLDLYQDLIYRINQVDKGVYSGINSYIIEYSKYTKGMVSNDSTNINGFLIGEVASIQSKNAILFNDAMRKFALENPKATPRQINEEYLRLRNFYENELIQEINNMKDNKGLNFNNNNEFQYVDEDLIKSMINNDLYEEVIINGQKGYTNKESGKTYLSNTDMSNNKSNINEMEGVDTESEFNERNKINNNDNKTVNPFPNLIPKNEEDLNSLIKTNKLEKIIINNQELYKDPTDGKLYITEETFKNLLDGLEAGGASEVTQEDIDREKALDAEDTNIYTVKEGDTLIDLANKFNTTVKDIKDKNNLVDNTIYIDQELMMPIVEEQELNTEIKESKIKYSKDSRVQSIVKSANELGISPIDLAAVIAQESSFRPDAVSVDPSTGDSYKGLIQFGPWEVKAYNFRDDMTFEEQMEIVVRFLKDRGVKPGHGVKEIYAAVFTGNVANLNNGGAEKPDSYGTTVNKALPSLIEGGSKYKMAIDFLQQKGPYLPE